MSLLEFKNLGPVSVRKLESVGIESRSQVEKLGPLATYLAVRQLDPNISLNLLWALVAGLQGIHWTDLSESEKSKWLQRLKRELD